MTSPSAPPTQSTWTHESNNTSQVTCCCLAVRQLQPPGGGTHMPGSGLISCPFVLYPQVAHRDDLSMLSSWPTVGVDLQISSWRRKPLSISFPVAAVGKCERPPERG